MPNDKPVSLEEWKKDYCEWCAGWFNPDCSFNHNCLALSRIDEFIAPLLAQLEAKDELIQHLIDEPSKFEEDAVEAVRESHELKKENAALRQQVEGLEEHHISCTDKIQAEKRLIQQQLTESEEARAGVEKLKERLLVHCTLNSGCLDGGNCPLMENEEWAKKCPGGACRDKIEAYFSNDDNFSDGKKEGD